MKNSYGSNYYMRKNWKEEFHRNRVHFIEREQREKEKARKGKTKGPRQIFLEKYKVTENIESAKEELSNQGYNTEIYENVFQKWIDEENSGER